MYRAGADPVVIVQDLLDLTHWLTRLKIVPDAAEGVAVSEAERGRAADMAGRLAMASLSARLADAAEGPGRGAARAPAARRPWRWCWCASPMPPSCRRRPIW